MLGPNGGAVAHPPKKEHIFLFFSGLTRKVRAIIWKTQEVVLLLGTKWFQICPNVHSLTPTDVSVTHTQCLLVSDYSCNTQHKLFVIINVLFDSGTNVLTMQLDWEKDEDIKKGDHIF
jgi:hypothetical protein